MTYKELVAKKITQGMAMEPGKDGEPLLSGLIQDAVILVLRDAGRLAATVNPTLYQKIIDMADKDVG